MFPWHSVLNLYVGFGTCVRVICFHVCLSFSQSGILLHLSLHLQPKQGAVLCCPFSRVWLFVTLCDSLDHSPPGSSIHGILQARIVEWVACPPPGDLPDPGIKPASLMSPALAGGLFTTSTTWEAPLRWTQADPVYPLTTILTGKLCILGKKINLLQSIKK